MQVFRLSKTGEFNYTVSFESVELKTERYVSSLAAIEWAKAYISSWTNATLDIEFEQVKSSKEYWNDKEKENSIY